MFSLQLGSGRRRNKMGSEDASAALTEDPGELSDPVVTVTKEERIAVVSLTDIKVEPSLCKPKSRKQPRITECHGTRRGLAATASLPIDSSYGGIQTAEDENKGHELPVTKLA